MKKFICSIFTSVFFIITAQAHVVVPGTAQAVAANFYSRNTQKQVESIALAYTETSVAGDPVYYAFNVNGTEGFVIVSAEDAGRPVIGYSTEGNFKVPAANSNPEFNFWMEKRRAEILSIRTQHIQPDQEITKEWANYASNKIYTPAAALSTPHAPLCQTKWDQSGGGSTPYNYYCPGGSLVGCVATAMAQIMRFYAFPAQGIGSHSYTAGSYGTLSVNFGATAYNWTNMPLTSSNADVATISYHCGVAVDMNYSPSGSGAQVCGGISAEYAYKTYFNYDPAIHCEWQNSYSTSIWCQMIVAEFAAGRPMQYQGIDASQGGHTWVCDGNDASDNMHMNWGWGGYSNGYFSVTNLVAGGFNFTSQLGGLFYIKPQIATGPLDAGTFAIASPNGSTCSTSLTPVVTIKNFGSNTLTSCTINYKIDAGTVQTFNWSGSVSSFQTANATLPAIAATMGSHSFTCYTSNPNGGTDGTPSNDQMQSTIIVMPSAATQQAPYVEGFESAGFPYADVYLNSSSGAAWNTTNAAAKTGASSMMLDNFTSTTGDVDEFITPGIDMSPIINQTMTFQVAHAQRNSSDFDALLVYTSFNCGFSWVQRYAKGGAALSTAGLAGSAFTPNASQWRQESVNIGNITGQTNVRFKFKFTSAGSGNNIYVDDINITGSGNSVAEEFANGFNMTVFPNPFTDNTTLSFNILDKYNVEIGVHDLIGKKVIAVSNNANLSAGSYALPLNLTSLKPGIYFVKMLVSAPSENAGEYFVTRKVIVQ